MKTPYSPKYFDLSASWLLTAVSASALDGLSHNLHSTSSDSLLPPFSLHLPSLTFLSLLWAVPQAMWRHNVVLWSSSATQVTELLSDIWPRLIYEPARFGPWFFFHMFFSVLNSKRLAASSSPLSRCVILMWVYPEQCQPQKNSGLAKCRSLVGSVQKSILSVKVLITWRLMRSQPCVWIAASPSLCCADTLQSETKASDSLLSNADIFSGKAEYKSQSLFDAPL